MKKILLILIICNCINTLNAQSTMIIPFFKQGESKQLLIEDDECYKTFETMIKEYFLKEERFQLMDYLTLLRKIKRDGILIPNSSEGAVEKLLQYADPDIYIIADISYIDKGKEHAIRINLTAHWTNTAETLAATTLYSGRRYFDDCFLLLSKLRMDRDLADNNKIEVFIQLMKEMIPGGDGESAFQPISILFSIDNDEYSYTSKLSNGKLLFQEIQSWIKRNAVDKKADADISSNVLRFQKVAVKLTSDDDSVYAPSDYGAELLIHLSTLSFKNSDESLEFEFNVIGNNINYTLQ